MKQKAKFLLVALLVTVSGVVANAQRNPDRRVNELERAVERMQDRLETLNRRVITIEQYLEGGHDPRPPKDVVNACMVVDSNTKRTFMNVSDSRIDAEFKAKDTCGKTVYSGYCAGTDNTHLKCDNNSDGEYSKVVCMVSDSNTKKTFRGEGPTHVAAEANAKIECQKVVYSGYCGMQPVSCEEIY